MASGRPTKEQLQAAYGVTIPDLIAPDLRLLLVGINPSLWSGWAGQHFARPGNRLWQTLHESGLTPRRLEPADTDELLATGIGITNLVARATARADELAPDEIRAGRSILEVTARRFRPLVVAVLGLSAYRTAFDAPKAAGGRQPQPIGGRVAWLLPNPSGLNANYQQPALNAAYAELRDYLIALP